MWCNDIEQLTKKLIANSINATQAMESYSPLQKKLKQSSGHNPNKDLELVARINDVCKNFEKALATIRSNELLEGTSSRKELELVIASIFVEPQVIMDSTVLERYQEIAGKEVSDELRKLATRPYEQRIRKLEQFGKQRRYIVHTLGQKDEVLSPEVDTELLALSLETAIRGNFAATKEQPSTEHLEQEFMNIPLAPPHELNELFTMFEQAVRKRC